MIDSIGVPKDSDLEPDYFLVNGSRNLAPKLRLMARRFRKHGFLEVSILPFLIGTGSAAHYSWLHMTKPFKYLVTGLFVNFIILFIAGSFLVVSTALSYNGRCGVFYFFGGQGRPCSLLEYMKEELGFYLLAAFSFLWWLILPAFLVIPGIGYLMGRLRK